MTRWYSMTAAAAAIVFVVVMAVAAQEPRKDRDEESRKGQDEPQHKGMMMRGMMGGRGMMGQGMMGQGMMPMMMMMEMHRQQAAMESQWEATGDGVFVLRSDKLLKYDNDLKLVKSVEIPRQPTPMMAHPGGEGNEREGRPRMPMGMGGMPQMMARMHGALPAKLAVTPEAVFVSSGSRLLKFGHDLELQKAVDLSEATPMTCPMCGQVMGHMRGQVHGDRDE